MAPTLATVLLFLLLHSATTTAATFTMKLIPRDSLHPNNLTQTQRLEPLVQHSKTYVRSRYGRSHMLRPVMTEKRMFYLVKILIGTEGSFVHNTLHFDLGSELTWIQCHPCNPCFRQPSITFDPRHSTSFHVLKKDHPLCVLPSNPNRPRSTYCTYVINYFDGTASTGFLSKERFTFDSDNGNELFAIYPLAFGCTMSSNFPENDVGEWDGILGMSQGKLSLVSQIGSIISHRFSYCLVKPESGLASFLTFGPEPRRDYRTTPILSFEGSGSYFLALEDISIGTNRLHLPADTFRHNGPNDGGFIVDSGATVTHLITPAYAAVANAMMVYLDGLHLSRVGPWNGLDLCYTIPPNRGAILPGMVFHFQGADYEMPWDNVFLVNEAGGIFCLGVMEQDRVSILGARMMANFRFSFNLEDHVLLFVRERCWDV